MTTLPKHAGTKHHSTSAAENALPFGIIFWIRLASFWSQGKQVLLRTTEDPDITALFEIKQALTIMNQLIIFI